MSLLERVGTLLRANLNDLIDRAEDPVTSMNQVILDMENQLLQVKTQVAIAIADHHLLDKKRVENNARQNEWVRKAELALEKQDEELARLALERSLACRDISKSYEEQLSDQKTQVENLKTALHKLDAKLADAREQAALLATRHRRARAIHRAADAQMALDANGPERVARRMGERVDREHALGSAKAELMAPDSVEERFAKLEKEDEIERLLAELKAKRAS